MGILDRLLKKSDTKVKSKKKDDDDQDKPIGLSGKTARQFHEERVAKSSEEYQKRVAEKEAEDAKRVKPLEEQRAQRAIDELEKELKNPDRVKSSKAIKELFSVDGGIVNDIAGADSMEDLLKIADIRKNNAVKELSGQKLEDIVVGPGGQKYKRGDVSMRIEKDKTTNEVSVLIFFGDDSKLNSITFGSSDVSLEVEGVERKASQVFGAVNEADRNRMTKKMKDGVLSLLASNMAKTNTQIEQEIREKQEAVG